MIDPRYRVTDDAPTVSAYVDLRIAAGLSPRTAEQAEPAIGGTWAWVTVYDGDDLAAMGRVIGDGGWYFVIADMATSPEHQRQGLGRAVLNRLLDRIEADAPAGAYVNLLADPAGRGLYTKLGFVETAPGSIGMRLDRRPREA